MKKSITKMLIPIFLTVCFALVASLAACNEQPQELGAVSSDAIYYDGEVLQWESVKNADYYLVVANGESITANANHVEYAADKDLTVSVKAMANDGNTRFTSSATATQATFTAVGPTTVSFKNGAFTWEAVEGVDKYVFEQNGIEYQGYTTENTIAPVRDKATDTASLKVKPYVTDAKSFGIWSATKTVTLLKDPENISYNESVSEIGGDQVAMSRIIAWDAVPNATGYKVQINGGEVYNTNINQFVFDSANAISWASFINMAQSQSFYVKVTAIGDESRDIVDSAASVKSFTYLDQIKNLQINNGILTWESIQGATQYNVLLNNETIVTTATNRYEDLEAGKPYVVKVRPGSSAEGTFSIWSEESTFTVTEAPTLGWSQNGEDEGVAQGSIVWQNVANNDGYELLIYRETYREGLQALRSHVLAKNTVNHVFEFSGTPGEYYVYVITKSVGEHASSKLSDPLRIIVLKPVENITFATGEIQDPEEDAYKASGKAYVAFNAPEYSTDVIVKLDDIAMSGVTKEVGLSNVTYAFSFDYTIEQASGGNENAALRVIRIQSVNENAGKFDAETSTVILNSPQSKDFILYQLATPLNVRCVSGVMLWNEVNQANGYYYVFEDPQGNVVASGRVFGTAVSVPEELKADRYSFKVAARGNGNIMVSGHYSNSEIFYKLPAPKNVRMEGNQLMWDDGDAVDGNLNVFVTDYRVSIGSKVVSVKNKEYTVQDQDISVSGTPVAVYAVGGRYNDNEITAISSDTSSREKTIMLYKLIAPEAPMVSNTRISWTKIDNADCYDVLYGSETVVTGVKGESIVIDETLLGKLYAISKSESKDFTVIAKPAKAFEEKDNIANYYYQSEKSLSKSIIVQNAPEVTEDTTTGEYKWSGIGTVSNYFVEVTYAKGKDTYILPREKDMTFIPTLLGDAGDSIKVSIYALGDNGLTRIRSQAVSFSFDLVKHNDPEEFTTTVAGSKITVKLNSDPAENAEFYGLNVGGTETRITAEQIADGYTFDANGFGKYDIKIRVLGGNRSGQNAYLPSNYGKVTTINMLRPLTEHDVRLSVADGKKVLEIYKLYLLNKYEYTLKYTNMGDGGQVNVLSETSSEIEAGTDDEFLSIELADVEGATTVALTIKAIGDGKDSFDCYNDSTLYFSID